MTQLEFNIELENAYKTMTPLCGHKLTSKYECHVIVNLIDGGTFEESIKICGLCQYNSCYPNILSKRIQTMKDEFLNI